MVSQQYNPNWSLSRCTDGLLLRSKQNPLKSNTNLAYDVNTMNPQLYSFKFSTIWLHDEKNMNPLLYSLFPAQFESYDKIPMRLHSYEKVQHNRPFIDEIKIYVPILLSDSGMAMKY